MRRVVVTEFISVDGVIEAPGGGEDFDRSGWAFQFDRGDEGNKFKLDELIEAEAQLLGRRTYEGFAAAWPDRPDDERASRDKMNSMKKYVVSNTLEDPSWENTDVLKGDAAGGGPQAQGGRRRRPAGGRQRAAGAGDDRARAWSTSTG